MNKVLELFGVPAEDEKADWSSIVPHQHCPFLKRPCIKVRKSDPSVAIGTCTLAYGKEAAPIIICPHRLLERKQIFVDCLHLLTNHTVGNEYHILREIEIPGGSVDFVIASVKNRKIHDFVGIELQTMDTTGTVWPERQRFLAGKGLNVAVDDVTSSKTFGMNWKMTAKTILVQLHHKIETFEHINKHFVLVLQDRLLSYMRREFSFDHLRPATLGDPMHIHAYHLQYEKATHRINLLDRVSTDAAGVARCLGLQADAKVELSDILTILEGKISSETTLHLE